MARATLFKVQEISLNNNFAIGTEIDVCSAAVLYVAAATVP